MGAAFRAYLFIGMTCGLLIVSARAALSQSPNWEVIYNQEARYSSWSGTRGYPPGLATQRGSGWQLYTPATIQLSGAQPGIWKLDVVGRGGYVTAKQTTPGATGSVSTLTDTVIAATWTYLNMSGIQPFVTLNVNMPSGTSALSGTDTFARMDPDLVDLATFGEGWNFGPTLGFNLPLTPTLILSMGVGHTWRGQYDRETTPIFPFGGRLNPGDVTTANISAGWKSGPLTVQVSGSYSHEGISEFNGMPGFQLGDHYSISGSTSYAWNDSSVSSVAASWTHTRKNTVIAPPTLLSPFTEAFNSNGNVYRVRFEHAFTAGDWSFGPIVSYMVRDNNAWSPTAYQFVPSKVRWSAGGNLRYFIGTQTVLYASVEHLWVEEDSRPSAVPGGSIPDLSFTGWMAMIGGTFRF